MALPQFITFTGVDEHTPLQEVLQMSRSYPIEWAVLAWPEREGMGRYPSHSFLRTFADFAGAHGLRVAVHLHGSLSDDVLKGSGTAIDALAVKFARVQVNTQSDVQQPLTVANWARRLGITPVLQCSGDFPLAVATVQWLFDRSRGRGLLPARWPAAPGDAMSGYAGGLGPGTVEAALAVISARARAYWLDLESGVRDGTDRFSIANCRRVCELVYGNPRPNGRA